MSRPAGVVPILTHQLRLFLRGAAILHAHTDTATGGLRARMAASCDALFSGGGRGGRHGRTAAGHAAAAQLWPPAVAALLSTALGILLTGAFHEDGFADVCDGMGGGYTAERTLEIMKDSRVGAFGAIGIMLMLALKVAALASLPTWTCRG
jgi:hypothetical protein